MKNAIMYATVIVNTDNEWEKFKNWFHEEGWVIFLIIGIAFVATIIGLSIYISKHPEKFKKNKQ